MSSHSRTTIQDIADALGLSRNTVSKALNDHQGLPEDTRKRVLEKAREMNYKSMGTLAASSVKQPTYDILLICKDEQISSNTFFSALIKALLTEIRQRNAVPVARFLSDQGVEMERIAQTARNAAGIIAMESLTAPMVRRLLDTGKPVAFFDYHSQLNADDRPCDIVLSEEQPLEGMIRRMYDNGARSFGFVGDPAHCLGFYRRYEVFRNITAQLGVKCGPQYDIRVLPGDAHALRGRPLAEAYVCANDYSALPLLKLLQELDVRIPLDVQVCGFDNIPESGEGELPLTTVAVDPAALASNMAMLLFDRIQNPHQVRRILTPKSTAVYRGTTR